MNDLFRITGFDYKISRIDDPQILDDWQITDVTLKGADIAGNEFEIPLDFWRVKVINPELHRQIREKIEQKHPDKCKQGICF